MFTHKFRGRLILASLAVGMMSASSLALMPGIASAAASSTSPPLNVHPLTGSGCVGNLTTDADQTCVTVNGTGLYIATAVGSVSVRFGPTHGHVELYGPQGLIKNSTTGTLVNNTTSRVVRWAPFKDEPRGTYCAETWLKTGSGYKSAGVACVSVS